MLNNLLMEVLMNMEIGTEVKLILVKRKIRQKDIAKKVGISLGQFNQFLNNWLRLSENHQKKVCRALNLNYEKFQKGIVKEL